MGTRRQGSLLGTGELGKVQAHDVAPLQKERTQLPHVRILVGVQDKHAL